MSEYSSCNQIAKDLVNKIIIEHTFYHGSDPENDCIVTLDAEHNGTSVECRKHFKGLISVPQLDLNVATVQEQKWKELYPDDNLHLVHAKHNICNDFPYLAEQFWIKRKNVLLWNFDMFSTFYTYPVSLVETMCKIPQIAFSSSESGTLVAFTFAAIPHGGFLAKLKNCDMWSDRLHHFRNMKTWKKKEIMNYYRKEMDSLWNRNKQICTKWEAVEIDQKQSKKGTEDGIFYKDNMLLYEGKTDNESTMCVMLYRVWHNCDCNVNHKMPQRELCKKRSKEMIEVEILDDLREKKRLKSDTVEDMDSMDIEVMDAMDIEDNTIENVDAITMNIDDVDVEDEDTTDTEDEDTEDEDTTDIEDEDTTDIEDEDTTDIEDEDTTDIEDEDTMEDSDLISIDSMTGSNSRNDTEDSGSTASRASADVDMFSCELHQHQIEMMIAVRDNERGYICGICGCGKSFPMVRSCLNYNTSVIFVPFKVLVDQFYKYFKDVPDVTVHKVNSEYVQDVPAPKTGEKTVYLANYDSFHRLVDLGITFDIVHWDEAHLATSAKRREKIEKIAGDANYDMEETIDMEDVCSIKGKKNFFWTATPNNIMRAHPEIYGLELYRYDFSTAVAEKRIKSFGIYISCNKGDDGEDDEWRKFEKVVETTCDFINNEGRKRVLIYVNRVSESDGNLLTVEHIRKQQKMFPAEYRMNFISAKIKSDKRNEIFKKFCEMDDAVHIIVSCRTISVGVDLPTCDAVVFADSTRNVIEITQRGCRALRLTYEERISGQFEKAKIFFPINVANTELQNVANRNEKIHQAIRGNPLEIPMLVLNLLKEGLDVDFDFRRDSGNDNEESKSYDGESIDAYEDNGGHCEADHREKVSVSFSFPYSDYSWEESSEEFAATMNNLCVSLDKSCVITGWDDMSEKEKIDYLEKWCIEHDGKRPQQEAKDRVEKKLAQWLGTMGRKTKRKELSEEKFNGMKQFDWWNKWLEKLREEKILGWDDVSEKEKIDYLEKWCIEHDGKRPNGRAKDPVEKKLAKWLDTMGSKTKRKKLSEEKFDGMKQFYWWNKWVENLEEEKEEKIPGWSDMSEKEKIDYLEKWCIEHDGKRPNGNVKDPVENKLGTLLATIGSKTKRKELSGVTFDGMKQFDWWNKWLEKLREDKEEKIPGWGDMSEKEKIDYLEKWCIKHDGKRPNEKNAKDPVEKKLAQWLSTIGRKKKRKELSEEKFDGMKQFYWWNEWVENLEEEKEEKIPGWGDMSEKEKIDYLEKWCIKHDGKRPNGNAKDPVENKLGRWLYTIGRKKKRKELSEEKFDGMKQFYWWNKWVENLEEEKEEKIPGWGDMSEKERIDYRIDYLEKWCIEHDGKRPQQKAKDPVEKKLARWLVTIGSKTKRKELSEVSFDGMKQFYWWNKWVENLEEEKIPGWGDMSEKERIDYLEKWCIEHDGKRPQQKAKDPVEKKLARWLGTIGSKTKRKELSEVSFDGMKQFDWWNKSLEKLKEEKDEKIPR